MFDREPVAITGAATGVVNAVIAVLIGFDVVHWTSEQIGLVVGLWNAVVALALVFLVRARVTPTVEPTDTPPPPAVTGEGA